MYTMTGFKVVDDKVDKIEINQHHSTIKEVRAVLTHCFTSSASQMIPRKILQAMHSAEVKGIIAEIVDETLANIDKGEIVGLRNPPNTIELVIMTDKLFEANYHMIHDDAPPKGETIQ